MSNTIIIAAIMACFKNEADDPEAVPVGHETEEIQLKGILALSRKPFD